MNYRDPDHLRSLGIEPHYFGLGFIQLKINETTRMHFWHPNLGASGFEEELHDHRYDFTSTVLVGSLTHEVYRFGALPGVPMDHEMAYVTCEPGRDGTNDPLAQDRVSGALILEGTYTMAEGSSYTLKHHVFHRIINTTRAVTLLKRGPKLASHARVIRPKGGAIRCPFATKMPVGQLWEMIDDLLLGEVPKGAPVLNPGYHMHEINKGVLGDASKIREECEEFLDAHYQGSKIMSLVELSDLYGAIAAYLRVNHGATVAMDDLACMSRITQRAFISGRRG